MWKAARVAELAKPVDQQHLQPFSPPKPTQVQEGLQTVMRAIHSLAIDPSFQRNMKRTFVAVCQAKDEELVKDPGHTGFRRYPGHEEIKRLGRGILEPAGTSLGDMLAQLSLIERGAEEGEEEGDGLVILSVFFLISPGFDFFFLLSLGGFLVQQYYLGYSWGAPHVHH